MNRRRRRLPPVDVTAGWVDTLTALVLGGAAFFLGAVMLRWWWR